MSTRRFTMSQWARSASLISRPVAAPAAAVGGATDMVATAFRGRVALCRGEKVALARDRHEHARETCARVFDRQRVAAARRRVRRVREDARPRRRREERFVLDGFGAQDF
jgi:hypothetical protein